MFYLHAVLIEGCGVGHCVLFVLNNYDQLKARRVILVVNCESWVAEIQDKEVTFRYLTLKFNFRMKI